MHIIWGELRLHAFQDEDGKRWGGEKTNMQTFFFSEMENFGL